jgi:hypothetical protein
MAAALCYNKLSLATEIKLRGGSRGAHPARAPPKIEKKYDFLA